MCVFSESGGMQPGPRYSHKRTAELSTSGENLKLFLTLENRYGLCLAWTLRASVHSIWLRSLWVYTPMTSHLYIQYGYGHHDSILQRHHTRYRETMVSYILCTSSCSADEWLSLRVFGGILHSSGKGQRTSGAELFHSSHQHRCRNDWHDTQRHHTLSSSEVLWSRHGGLHSWPCYFSVGHSQSQTAGDTACLKSPRSF